MGRSAFQKSKIELRPDGWERFERAIDAAVESGPKHRAMKPKEQFPRKGCDKGKSRS